MKVAYISHHKRPNYEFDWISKMPADLIRFFDTDFSGYEKKYDKKSNVEFFKVSFKESAFLSHFFHSTARRISYQGIDEGLKDIDVIISLEVFSSLSAQFVKYCSENKKKSVVLVYELISEHPIYKIWPFSRDTKYVLKNADLFVCVSNKAKDHLEFLGCDPGKIVVVYPGIDLQIFRQNRGEKRVGEKRIVYVGKLEIHKGINDLLDVFKKIVSLIPDVELFVVGDGSMKSKVLAAAEDTPGIKYFGSVENKNLPKILNECSVYVLPSKDSYRFGFKMGSEQFGFSLVEAMACGLPVVSTYCGAIPEIITENNKLCKQFSKKCLLSKIYNLLSNSDDAISIGLKNVALVEARYDLRKQSRMLYEVISER